MGLEATERKALFVADASWKLGTGHVSRCLALARSLRARGWSLDWALRGEVPSVAERLSRIARTHTCDLTTETIVAIASAISADWLVLDVPGIRLEAKPPGEGEPRTLVLDDLGNEPVIADVVWNGNVGAEHLSHQYSPRAALLLGSRFALVDPAFVAPRASSSADRLALVVAFGGSDPFGLTLRVLRALSPPYPMQSITILVGGLNRHRADIESVAKTLPFRSEVVLDATDVPQRLAAADLAVIGGGIMTYECMASGVPCLFVPHGPPQRFLLERIQRLGFGEIVSLEDLMAALRSLAGDVDRRSRMSQLGQGLIDGQGPKRVADFLDRWKAPSGA